LDGRGEGRERKERLEEIREEGGRELPPRCRNDSMTLQNPRKTGRGGGGEGKNPATTREVK